MVRSFATSRRMFLYYKKISRADLMRKLFGLVQQAEHFVFFCTASFMNMNTISYAKFG